MNTDFLSQIEARLPEFSKAQKLIARYILDHYEKAAFMTASRLGATVGVSESTVVRFASEVGCDGYPQLQKGLQEIIRNRLTSVQRMDCLLYTSYFPPQNRCSCKQGNEQVLIPYGLPYLLLYLSESARSIFGRQICR